VNTKKTKAKIGDAASLEAVAGQFRVISAVVASQGPRTPERVALLRECMRGVLMARGIDAKGIELELDAFDAALAA